MEVDEPLRMSSTSGASVCHHVVSSFIEVSLAKHGVAPVTILWYSSKQPRPVPTLYWKAMLTIYRGRDESAGRPNAARTRCEKREMAVATSAPVAERAKPFRERGWPNATRSRAETVVVSV